MNQVLKDFLQIIVLSEAKKQSPAKKASAKKPSSGKNKPGESKEHPGYFHRGGGYYSKGEDGLITHRTVDGALKQLSPEEQKEKNAGAQKPTAANKRSARKAKQTKPDDTPQEEPKAPEEIVADTGDAEEVNEKGKYCGEAPPERSKDCKEVDKFQTRVLRARNPKQLFEALDEMAQDEREQALQARDLSGRKRTKKDKKGKTVADPKAGAGGLVPSTGETLCTDAQTAMINGDYESAKVRTTPEYEKMMESLSNEFFTTDKAGESVPKKPSREIEEIADMHGIDLYDENGNVTYAGMQACLEIVAEERVWIEQQDREFSKTVAGKKFGEGEAGREARHAWLRAAFHSGYSLQANGPANWDRSQPARVLKANARTDGAVEELLKRNLAEAQAAGDSEAVKHYTDQLEKWKKFQSYHDTYMVYTDKNGRTCVFNISNKKGSDLRDPHNNTSPIRRLKNFASAISQWAQGTIGKKEAEKVIRDIGAADAAARSGVDNIDNSAYAAAGKLKPTPTERELLGGLFGKLPTGQKESEVGDKYYLEIIKPGSASRKLLDEAGVDTDDPEAVVTHILKAIANAPRRKDGTIDTSGIPKAWLDRVVLKYGTLGQRVFDKIAQYKKENPGVKDDDIDYKAIGKKLGLTAEEVEGIYKSKTMRALADIKASHAEGLAGVNSQFVRDLHESDGTEPGHRGENGPAVETYIRGTMQNLHLDTYITNYDEDVMVESGGMGTKPIDVRRCMAKLSGFKGEIDTPEGRAKLIEHLGKNLKVEPGSDAVFILSETEVDAEGNPLKIYIAKETWRQSGKSKKVASGFGDHLRACLMKATGDRLRQSKRG